LSLKTAIHHHRATENTEKSKGYGKNSETFMVNDYDYYCIPNSTILLSILSPLSVSTAFFQVERLKKG
jgi:hypothetical protein